MKFTQFIKENIIKKVYEDGPIDDPVDDNWFRDDNPDEGEPGEPPAPEPAAPAPAPAPYGARPGKKKKGKDGEGEEEKEEKKFEVGDVLVLIDTKKSNKLPPDAYDFLMTFKTFTVRKVNDKGKIDLGCHISKNEPGVDGKPIGVEKIYMFSTNRFELKDGPATVNKEEGGILPIPEED